jgi:hypothetical protein
MRNETMAIRAERLQIFGRIVSVVTVPVVDVKLA